MTQDIQGVIRSKYGAVAASGLTGDSSGVSAEAEAFGYTADELQSIPSASNMGLSCGNPTAFASLKAGETVVDLGCGGGLDVFLASGKVDPGGRAIGIDMTPEMIERAQENAEAGMEGKPFAASSCCGSNPCGPAPAQPGVHAGLAKIMERYNVNDYAASVRVYAFKPASEE
jgi:SAM-dependent methyltransferase